MTTIWADFEALKSLSGELYTEHRDRLLAAPDLRSLLAPREKSAAWEDVIQAKILLGWLDHRERYEGLLRRLDAEDPPRAQQTVLGMNLIWNAYALRAARNFKEVALPISWEAILRYADDLPGWKVICFLRMIGAVPHPLSAEPLLRFVERAPDYELRHAAVLALAALPRAPMETRVREAQARHEEAGKLLRSLLDEAL